MIQSEIFLLFKAIYKRVLLGLCYANYEEKKPKRALSALESYIKLPQPSPSPDVPVLYRLLYQITEIIAAAIAVYNYNFSENEMEERIIIDFSIFDSLIAF